LLKVVKVHIYASAGSCSKKHPERTHVTLTFEYDLDIQ